MARTGLTSYVADLLSFLFSSFSFGGSAEESACLFYFLQFLLRNYHDVAARETSSLLACIYFIFVFLLL